MEPYKQTRIWATAFGDQSANAATDEQIYFRTEFEEMRERVLPIVARILRDMPGYTVHDITHLDALWETANLVTDDAFQLNPAEAFVFGGSVLLHDAAMTLAAYPGGLADLKATVQWKDAIALRMQADPQFDEDSPNPEIATEVLRLLHARKAAELAVQGWKIPSPDGSPTQLMTYLIEKSDLRNFYGPTIGLIAHSHWWPISKVEQELDRYLGAMPPKTMNKVDLLKIAILLRVADAIHLDRRRAPPFVRALDRPTGLSALHWDFQARLAFPHVESDAIVFTAGETCPANGAEGWWLAYDALSLADRELRDAELLLRQHNRPSLRIRRVEGANNPQELAKLLPVDGWIPVETRIRVSDIPRIVQVLGGEKLYGSNAIAPLRELIQNAIDAIDARRRQQNRFDWGRILVSLTERDGSVWLTVEDDGVGMSEYVLTNTLLDFGSSLWRSAQITEEFPGLASRGMNSIGRFGIGFFSVFMLADEVHVTTRRYDRGVIEGLLLSFKNGVNSRPLITRGVADKTPLDGGTRVEIKLKHDPRFDNELYFASSERSHGENSRLELLYSEREEPTSSLATLVAWLAPASDIRLVVNEWGKESIAVGAGDWKTVSPEVLAIRCSAKSWGGPKPSVLRKLMQPITDEGGATYGRAALYPSFGIGGAITSGGIRIQPISHITGVIIGNVTTAARNVGVSALPQKVLANWATRQADVIGSLLLKGELKALSAEVVLECGGNIMKLPIVLKAGRWLKLKELQKEITSKSEIIVVIGDIIHDDEDGVGASSFDENFSYSNQIFMIPKLWERIMPSRAQRWKTSRISYLGLLFEAILEKTWGEVRYSTDEVVVGDVDGIEITRPTTTYHRVNL